jgi:hypothetical protein
VSVLDNDVESRQQLETSVDEMVSRLSRNDAHQLQESADRLQSKRDALLVKYRQLSEEILNIRTAEYREIVIGGKAFGPSDAARYVHAGRTVVDYIPSPVEFGIPLPLSESELAELYRTNNSVSAEDESELQATLPDPVKILSAAEFTSLVRERAQLASLNLNHSADLWDGTGSSQHISTLENISTALRRLSTHIWALEAWQTAAILAGKHGGIHRKPWDALLTQIDGTWNAASNIQDLLIQYDPKLPQDLSPEQALEVSSQISEHFKHNGSISFLKLLSRPKWKHFIRSSRTGMQTPNRYEHFAALTGMADLTIRRQQLLIRWKNQMVPLGAPAPEEIGSAPEQLCHKFNDAIKKCLDWHEKEWKPLEQGLAGTGLRIRQLLEEQPGDFSAGELYRLAKFLSGPLQDILASRFNAIRWQETERKIQATIEVLEQAGSKDRCAVVVDQLRQALRALDPRSYRDAFERLNELLRRRKDLVRRRELLKKLGAGAYLWAAAIRARVGIHGQPQAPESVQDAWLWRQLHDELERRGRTSLKDLQERSERCLEEIQQVTTHYKRAPLSGVRLWCCDKTSRKEQHRL